MKALEFLYALEIDAKTDILISEAIEELEELIKPKTCETCKHFFIDTRWVEKGVPDCKALSIKYIEKDFYCNKYKPKG